MQAEVCGVLIGAEQKDRVVVEACIRGQAASEGAAHVTFTQDTWEHIYSVKDAEYPEKRIVGWYHTHPGFGVFLSDHDLFIHKNFFSAHTQIAWVFDPHSDEEGCFGWHGDGIVRMSDIKVTDDCAGEAQSGREEPDVELLGQSGEAESQETKTPRWVRWLLLCLTHLVAILLGLLVCLLIFPRQVIMKLPPSVLQQLEREARQGAERARPAPEPKRQEPQRR
jgi:proteasome lid subunit RPN8/RPN11